MEVKINREIRNYTESMFFGLSLRQFVFSLLAVGVAVLLYFVLKPYVGTETVSWMCIHKRRNPFYTSFLYRVDNRNDIPKIIIHYNGSLVNGFCLFFVCLEETNIHKQTVRLSFVNNGPGV